jgi:glyoxylase-like metal-dependent hydrolase (beta-lactamase superfamily II)
MAIGEPHAVDLAGVSGVYYLDTGMFDTPGYTSIYVVDADRPAIVDTGIGTNHERVLSALDRLGIATEDVAVIAPTHVHLDHAGGAGHLAAACPNATVAVHTVGAPHLVDPTRLVEGTKRAVGDEWRYYAEPVPVPADRVRELTDGDVIDLGHRQLDVYDAPGHAPHQAVFHDPADAVVFTADAAGIYLPGRDELQPTTPVPNFDLEQALDDVAMLASLDPDVLCYPHFGPARTADRLDAYAALLESWVADVDAAREQFDDVDAIVDHVVERDDLAAVWGPRRARAHVALNVEGVLRYLETREA